MSSWNELLKEQAAASSSPDEAVAWLWQKLNASLDQIRRLRDGRNVILYGSGFLQKPGVPPEAIMITLEDVNGLMAVIRGMECDKHLTLILHTPGGVTHAAETIVNYLRSKFDSIEVIVPYLAMSAGTMISLATDRIVMGRPSQLGPIDPQLQGSGRSVSAQAVVSLFEQAREEIQENRQNAALWAPITQSMGPSLLQDARDSLTYSEAKVAEWLNAYMLSATQQGSSVARHFLNSEGNSKNQHGRRIDRNEARTQGLKIEDLEDNQELQEAVMRTYHLMTMTFEQTLITKMVYGSNTMSWLKSWGQAAR